MFVVEKGMPGFSLGQQIKNKLGMRSSGTAELVFEDVPVPLENRIGEEGQASLCMVCEYGLLTCRCAIWRWSGSRWLHNP